MKLPFIAAIERKKMKPRRARRARRTKQEKSLLKRGFSFSLRGLCVLRGENLYLARYSCTCFFLLALTTLAVAQGGSGDLPPVPKSTSSKAKPKPAPTKAKTTTPAKTSTKVVTFKEPTTVGPITFNQDVEGKIDEPTAGRIPPNVFFQEFALTASDADLFTIQLNSPAASLKVELLDANKISLPLKRDEHSGAYQLATPELVLPADGE